MPIELTLRAARRDGPRGPIPAELGNTLQRKLLISLIPASFSAGSSPPFRTTFFHSRRVACLAMCPESVQQAMRPSTLHQLLLARRVYEDALGGAREDPFHRLRAVIFLDLSIELTLSAAAAQCSLSPKSDKFPDLLKCIEEAMLGVGAKFPKGDIHRLHQVRNLAQHSGNVPDAIQVDRFVEPARQAHREVLASLLDLDWENLGIWEAVNCLAIREALRTAEVNLRGQADTDLREARILSLALGVAVLRRVRTEMLDPRLSPKGSFSYLLAHYPRSIPSTRNRDPTAEGLRHIAHHLLPPMFDELHQQITVVGDHLVLAELGISRESYFSFLLATQGMLFGDNHFSPSTTIKIPHC